MTESTLLDTLQSTIETFLATDPRAGIEHPVRLSTDPLSDQPLRYFDPPLIGVASAQDPLWGGLKTPDVIGPAHLSPGEWLPGARSVVSVFLPFTKPVRFANRVKTVPATEWLYGRIEGQVCVLAVARLIAATIEAAGGQALEPATDKRFAVVDLRSNWSERHAAFIAGLGTFSLSRSLITRRGSAGRLTSLITDLELVATPRAYEGTTQYCSDCGLCIGRCPCQAIDETGKDNQVCSVYLGQVMAQYAPRYGCGKCQTAVPCESRIPTKRPLRAVE